MAEDAKPIEPKQIRMFFVHTLFSPRKQGGKVYLCMCTFVVNMHSFSSYTHFHGPEVTLCGRQDDKIQELSS